MLSASLVLGAASTIYAWPTSTAQSTLQTPPRIQTRSIVITAVPSRDLLSAFANLLQAIAHTLPRLRALSIIDSPEIFEIVSSSHFPFLTTLAVTGYDGIFPFIRRHARLLRSLEILLSFPLDLTEAILYAGYYIAPPLQPIVLPELSSLVTSVLLAPFLVPGSRLSMAALCWPDEIRIQRTHSAAAGALSKRKQDELVLRNNIYSWDHGIVPALAEHIPSLTQLSLRNLAKVLLHGTLIHSVTFADIHPFLSSMEDSLSKFHALITICITYGHRPVSIVDADDEQVILAGLNADSALITRWGNFCPTLLTVTLPATHLRWDTAPAFKIWIPNDLRALFDHKGNLVKKVPSRSAMYQLRWLLAMLLESEPDKLPNHLRYMSLAVLVVGVEGLRRLQDRYIRDQVLPAFELQADESLPESPEVEWDYMGSRIGLDEEDSDASSEEEEDSSEDTSDVEAD
ncbi:F-box domain-containing protein [Mycena kentingensis (nom. inval.)]|nr:F-box domain-containing protein [Mycena kentingensis (nom. inval.)]